MVGTGNQQVTMMTSKAASIILVPLDKVQDLPSSQYKLYLRDVWVANMSRSEEGRKFLET